jgi:hypothetical protein
MIWLEVAAGAVVLVVVVFVGMIALGYYSMSKDDPRGDK